MPTRKYELEVPLTYDDSCRFSMILSGSRRFSMVLIGSRRFLVVLSCSRRFSMVLCGSSRRFSHAPSRAISGKLIVALLLYLKSYLCSTVGPE